MNVNPVLYDSSKPVALVIHEPDEVVTELIKTSYEAMRQNLVIHFDYRWKNKDIKWPSRTGKIFPKNFTGLP